MVCLPSSPDAGACSPSSGPALLAPFHGKLEALHQLALSSWLDGKGHTDLENAQGHSFPSRFNTTLRASFIPMSARPASCHFRSTPHKCISSHVPWRGGGALGNTAVVTCPSYNAASGHYFHKFWRFQRTISDST